MSDRDAFLKALAENEDDTPTRLVYADWLEEQGEHEEADRQRKWPAAKEWLVRFCREVADEDEDLDDEDLDDEGPSDDNPYSFFNLSLKDLLQLGRQAVEDAGERDIHLYCGAAMSLMEALQDNRQEFWKNWSIVTGIPLSPEMAEQSRFSCAC